jgi:hypothetical protein
MNKLKNTESLGQILKLLCSIRFLSPTLVRAANPRTYTLNCVYSEEEVNNSDNLEGSKYIKHIVTCRDRSCNYYRRLVNNIRPGPDAEIAGAVVLGVTNAALFFATGGLSILVIATLSAGSLIGGDLLRENSVKKTIKEIENELKEK